MSHRIAPRGGGGGGGSSGGGEPQTKKSLLSISSKFMKSMFPNNKKTVVPERPDYFFAAKKKQQEFTDHQSGSGGAHSGLNVDSHDLSPYRTGVGAGAGSSKINALDSLGTPPRSNPPKTKPMSDAARAELVASSSKKSQIYDVAAGEYRSYSMLTTPPRSSKKQQSASSTLYSPEELCKRPLPTASSPATGSNLRNNSGRGNLIDWVSAMDTNTNNYTGNRNHSNFIEDNNNIDMDNSGILTSLSHSSRRRIKGSYFTATDTGRGGGAHMAVGMASVDAPTAFDADMYGGTNMSPANNRYTHSNNSYRSSNQPQPAPSRKSQKIAAALAAAVALEESAPTAVNAAAGKPSNKPLCCDKCDGKHETDKCPYYKKQREDHPDAKKGKSLSGTSLLPGLHLRNARVVRQPGDGSCLFHSMSYGLGCGNNANKLRAEICQFIKANPNLPISESPLADWVKWDSGRSPSEYARYMSRGSWGGGIEMACVSIMKSCNIHVYERSGMGFKRISAFDHPSSPENKPVVRVLYCGGVHYDALVA